MAKYNFNDKTDDRLSARAMAARRPGMTGIGMKFEYPDGTVRDKWGNIINEEKD